MGGREGREGREGERGGREGGGRREGEGRQGEREGEREGVNCFEHLVLVEYRHIQCDEAKREEGWIDDTGVQYHVTHAST